MPTDGLLCVKAAQGKSSCWQPQIELKGLEVVNLISQKSLRVMSVKHVDGVLWLKGEKGKQERDLKT